MKKILAIVGIALLFTSCIQQSAPTPEPEYVTPEVETIRVNNLGVFPYQEIDQLNVIEIDGCQYIVANGQDNHEPTLTHKGNCKYCRAYYSGIIRTVPTDTIK